MEWKLFADLAERADRHVDAAADPGDTVGDALDALLAEYPQLEDRVLEDGEVSPDINVLRNGADVHAEGDGLETELEAGDELALFPPVSGG